MSFHEDFRTKLLAVEPVAALVVDRVVWDELPEGRTRPLVCLWDITNDGGYTYEGPDGLDQTMIQVDCWDLTIAGALDLAARIRAGIDGVAEIVGGTSFQGVFFRSRRMANEPVVGSPAQRYSRVSLDVEVWHAAT